MWGGVLRVDDGVAKNMRWKGAAVLQRDILSQKDVIKNLLHGPLYTVHSYSIYDDVGYGIVEGYLKANKDDPGKRALFLTIFGGKLPVKNPASFSSPNGTTIALGG